MDNQKPDSIGLITGMPEELEALIACGEHHRTEASVTTLTLAGLTIHACCSGIGKVNAAATCEALIQKYSVGLLAIVGTAGGLQGVAPGPYLLHEAVQSDYGSWYQGEFRHFPAGTIPIGKPRVTPWVSSVASQWLAANPNLPHARIATADSFVADAAQAAKIATALDAQLVDMETAAMAQVAHRHSLDWLGVKAVSDSANEDSARDFSSTLRDASAQSVALLETQLQNWHQQRA